MVFTFGSTRAGTQNIHRASRFYHHFAFLPAGGGSRLDAPVAEQVLINRAREHANPVRPGVLRVQSEKRVDGYTLDGMIPNDALTGFNLEDYPRLVLMRSLIEKWENRRWPARTKCPTRRTRASGACWS